MKRKDFGQHFLIDKQVIDDELHFAVLKKDDIVLEIGPGKGALTVPMAKKVKKIIAIEKDPDLCNKLLPLLPSNVNLICSDVLLCEFDSLPKISKVVSNLPYKISSPITFKLLKLNFEKAVLLYQKEFAQRMIAKPNSKDYCRLSVGIYYHAFCRILQDVSKESFYPQPKIESCIVEIIPRNNPPFNLKNEGLFFEVTKELFSHRRKKIKTILTHKYGVLKNIPFSEKRVEMISPEQIAEICNTIYSQLYE